VKVRSPHLYGALRSFCLAAFAVLGSEAESSSEIPFEVQDHGGLYEYRPLVRAHVEARAPSLQRLEDTRIAIAELRNEPAATIFVEPDREDSALFRAMLVPLLIATA